MLDQQPRRLRASATSTPPARSHEHPASLHALAVKDDFEVALLVHLTNAVLASAFLRLVPAAIPQHHRAATVLTLRDRALECVVLDRMIFHLHGQALDARISRRSLRHRPAFHHAI